MFNKLRDLNIKKTVTSLALLSALGSTAACGANESKAWEAKTPLIPVSFSVDNVQYGADDRIETLVLTAPAADKVSSHFVKYNVLNNCINMADSNDVNPADTHDLFAGSSDVGAGQANITKDSPACTDGIVTRSDLPLVLNAFSGLWTKS